MSSLTPWREARAELEPIEGIIREIDDLTSVLQVALTPDQFRLVWSLRDRVERLGLAEGLLRERRMLDSLAQHLPRCAPAIRTVREHVLTMDVAVDDRI